MLQAFLHLSESFGDARDQALHLSNPYQQIRSCYVQQSPEDVDRGRSSAGGSATTSAQGLALALPKPPCALNTEGCWGVQKGGRRNKSTPNWPSSAFPPASRERKPQFTQRISAVQPTHKMTSKNNAIEGGARGRSGTGPFTSPPPC